MILLMIFEFLWQVNRELMEVIESLQRRIVEEENSEELSNETDNTHEELDGVTDNMETSDVTDVLEEEIDDTLDAQIVGEVRQTDQFRNESSRECEPNCDHQNGVDPVKPEKAAGIELLQDPAVESKVKQTCKRKQPNEGGNLSTLDAGAKTSSKKARLQVAE